MTKKQAKLNDVLASYNKVAVAFSGGVDSSFLLKSAALVLGNKNVLALLADTPGMPDDELRRAVAFAKEHSIRLVCVKSPKILNKISDNPANRCYICKKVIFRRLKSIAKRGGFKILVDGSNYDDRKTFRPGRKALGELKIESPLEKARITKKEVRAISERIGLSTYSLPQMACLFTRFPHGTRISSSGLKRVAAAEKVLRQYGNFLLRVRVHGDTAKVEVHPDKIPFMLGLLQQKKIIRRFHNIGFKHIAIDIEGYKANIP